MGQILTQEGRFKARPRTWAVEENKNTGTLQFVCEFDVIAVLNGSDWEDWTRYALQKTGYFYLSKKDGSPNEATIRSLRDALGWDGLSLEALQLSDWSKIVVQITTGFEEYDGGQRLKIRFINPENWEGAQVKPLDQAALKSLNAKWGAKLRAVTPKPAAKPPVSASTVPPPPPPEDTPQSLPSTRETAWARLLEVFGGNADAAKQNWPALLAKVIPNKPPTSFSAADWAAVEARASEALPF